MLHSETSRTNTSSQSEIFMEKATEYDASSEASSRETSKPSFPESGNLTARSVYSPLPEMAILYRAMHDAIHAVREQQGRVVTRRFLQQQQEVAASKLKCLSQIWKTSTLDPPLLRTMHSQDKQELDQKWPMVPPAAVQRIVTENPRKSQVLGS